MQRIESYKNSIHRDELLRLGDEAVSELQATSEGQFVLTEVLMLDSVDRLIMKRLSLRPYRRWRQQFLKLRAAQQQPTHWGMETGCPVARVLPRLEPEDTAVVVGAGGEAASYLLAAYDVAVTFIAGDLGAVERIESRVAAESLASRFAAYVVQLGLWLPELPDPLHLVVIDTGALADLDPVSRRALLEELQEQTALGGVHILLPGDGLAPEALLTHYAGWEPEPPPRSRRAPARGAGLLLTKPDCPTATD